MCLGRRNTEEELTLRFAYDSYGYLPNDIIVPYKLDGSKTMLNLSYSIVARYMAIITFEASLELCEVALLGYIYGMNIFSSTLLL